MSTDTKKSVEIDESLSSSGVEEEGNESDKVQVYEIGFHILPTIPEEKLPEEFFAVKEAIEKRGGVLISEDFPKQIVLAYKMHKEVSGQKKAFDRAFFGWIKFEINPESLASIKEEVEANENVLRFLLIKTVRENTLVSKDSYASEINKPGDSDDSSTNNDDSDSESSDDTNVPVSEEEIDKGIEKLVGNE